MQPGVKGAVSLAAALILLQARPAAAQTTQPNEIDLARILAAVPSAFQAVVAKGHSEFFRVVENLELLRIESEIDRLVGRPRLLNDSTTYKLSLLPFQIRYPIYRQLVDQMTRLDTVRSRQIHMVTPDSVTLVDLRIQPYTTLDALVGEGAGNEVQQSLLGHFSAREIADLSVFMLAQQPYFPESEEDWQRTKHQVARAGIPIALGALATGAFFDAGALGHSATIVARGDGFRLRYYAGFRGLGVHMRPYLRAGLAVRGLGLEAAAGLADQVRPLPTEPDQAVELAVREGWLNQLARPAGVDVFIEAAIKRALLETPSFPGNRTRARGGLFFKREQLPGFPTLTLRGSFEGESDLGQQLHLVGGLGVERPRTGIATMLQASRVLTPPSANLPDDTRLNVFLVGTMEPLSAAFTEDMSSRAHRCDEEWTALESLEQQREAWQQALLTRGTASRSPEEARAALAEMERILLEREERLLRLAGALADYLEARRRAYSIQAWSDAPDRLHGPLDAAVVSGARDRVLGRLRDVSTEIEGALGPLVSLRDRMNALDQEIRHLEAVDPAGAALATRRRVLAALGQQWDLETGRVRVQLATRASLRADGSRILGALGKRESSIRDWDRLGATARIRIARLALSSP